jgi:hypothetical protein
MEFMIQWFWIIKLLVAGAFLASLYKLYKSKFKSKFWWGVTGVGIILLLISPVKLDVDTRSQQVQTNSFIKATKEIPSMITDDSFKDSQKDLGITGKDLP